MRAERPAGCLCNPPQKAVARLGSRLLTSGRTSCRFWAALPVQPRQPGHNYAPFFSTTAGSPERLAYYGAACRTRHAAPPSRHLGALSAPCPPAGKFGGACPGKGRAPSPDQRRGMLHSRSRQDRGVRVQDLRAAPWHRKSPVRKDSDATGGKDRHARQAGESHQL